VTVPSGTHDLSWLAERQNIVETFVNDSLLRQSLFVRFFSTSQLCAPLIFSLCQEEHLRRVPDISRLAKKFLQRRARLQDIVVVYQVCARFHSDL
jgi:DNA mismatch repair ATPase MutS